MGLQRLSGFAQGLWDLIGSQNRGEQPKELDDVIKPIVDLTDLYAFRNVQTKSASTAALAVGLNAGSVITIPPGEVWFVQHVQMNVSCGAGEACGTFAPYLQLRQNAIELLGDEFGAPVVANAEGLKGVVLDGWWLPSGTVFGMYVSNGVTLAPSGGLTVQACPFRT